MGKRKMLPLLLLMELVLAMVAMVKGNNLPELNCDAFCEDPCTPQVKNVDSNVDNVFHR